jgi:hypothetical protein
MNSMHAALLAQKTPPALTVSSKCLVLKVLMHVFQSHSKSKLVILAQIPSFSPRTISMALASLFDDIL